MSFTGRSRGYSNSSRPRYQSSFSHGGGGRSRSRGPKQKSFDPSHIIRNAGQTSVAPEPTPVVTARFEDFNLHPQLLSNIKNKGYEQPTPIQEQVIPHLLLNEDVIGSAQTGTGKTAAFLIPLIQNRVSIKNARVLVVVPTRELAVQIEKEFISLARGLQLYSALCIGGTSIHNQMRNLQRRPQFVIATPGRVIDLQERGYLDFGDFSTFVLDEVDRMVDMGFINDVRYMVSRLPEERQAILFSATIPPKLADVISSFVRNPFKVSIKSQLAATNVNQDIVKLQGRSKVEVLAELLNQTEFEKVLVFGRTQRGIDQLAYKLQEIGLDAVVIHGSKTQYQRQRAITMFSSNRVNVMVATDVVARGIDIDNVTHVINYDLPQTYEEYIHRIGRTGRANRVGVALSFVD